MPKRSYITDIGELSIPHCARGLAVDIFSLGSVTVKKVYVSITDNYVVHKSDSKMIYGN